MKVRTFIGALFFLLAATQLAGAQVRRSAAELKPKPVTTTATGASTSSVLGGNQCNPQAMLLAPETAVPIRDALADAGVDIGSPIALASLFLQEDGLTTLWSEVGEGNIVTLSYNDVDVTMFVRRWRVADDDSQVLFEATITGYRLPLLANLSSFFIGSTQVEAALQRVMERPLLGHIRAKGNETLLLSLEVDPAFVRAGDPNGMSWRFGLEPGGVTTLVMAAECKCCNAAGRQCTDDGCDGHFACGDDIHATWTCGRYESSGEGDVALCLAPVAACLLWKGFRRMYC